jgi:aminoglycoside 6'-N-acetyltransferase
MITFRVLAHSDLPALQRWLNTPHVCEWWGAHAGAGALGGTGRDAATEVQVKAKYGPGIDHGGPTHRFIIELEGRPIGLIQWYHLRDFPDYARAIGEDPATSAGLDLLIGDPGAVNRGIGSRALDAFVTSVVFRFDEMNRVVAGPAASNARSIRAFEKAGFRCVRTASVAGEPVPEIVMVRLKD